MTQAQDPQDKMRATLVKAAQEIERLRQRLSSAEASATEPIAIVGVGVRLPGHANDLDALWRVLESGIDAVGPVPPTRWSGGDTQAALADAVDEFDAGFFSLSPREAAAIDPQHRMLLETTWEALENAGIVPGSLVDSNTGVFIGVGPSEYGALQERAGRTSDAYEVMGSQLAFASGRVAYHFGLQGPTLGVPTACSSALVALHLACQALRSGECTLALVGAAQVLASEDAFSYLRSSNMLAADGRCKTFSAHADGYGRGEGAVVLVLERQSIAREMKRRIHAVVRGSAVNHGGASSGIMAPNGTAQRKVIRAALQSAKLTGADIDYVECNGTGTALGDTIEVQAIAEVLGKGRFGPIMLGATKPNLGHLEAASGLVGVAKVLVSLSHGELPATLHTRPHSTSIEWERLGVRVVEEVQPWPSRPEGPRRAGVSAFGLSGTNAHIVLEEAARLEANAADLDVALPFVLSGRGTQALKDQAHRLAQWCKGNQSRPADVAWTLATARTHFPTRTWMVGRSLAEVERWADAIAREESPMAITAGRLGKLALVLSLPVGSATDFRAWLACFPEFRAEAERAWRVVVVDERSSLTTWLEAPTERELQLLSCIARIATWRAFGLRPDVVVGLGCEPTLVAYAMGQASLESGWSPESGRSAESVRSPGLRPEHAAEYTVMRMGDTRPEVVSAADTAEMLKGGVVVEVGPPVEELRHRCGPSANFLSSREPASDIEHALRVVGELHCMGAALDWSAVLGAHAPNLVRLPTYAFQRRPYWNGCGERRISGLDATTSEVLRAAGEVEPPSTPLDVVRQQLAVVLHASVDEVDIDLPFASLGVDSLMAVELATRINERLGLSLPATIIWSYPSARELASHIDQQLADAPTVAGTRELLRQLEDLERLLDG